MQISHNGLSLLKKLEGFKSRAYKDTGGVWTIGYGTTISDGKFVQEGDTCTEYQAETWLQADVASAQTAVNQMVKVPLLQHQFDALVSFVYNVGSSAFEKSTMLRLLNTKEYAGASAQFDRWVFDNGKKIEGLVNRRKTERNYFDGK